MNGTYVHFRVGDESYALAVQSVLEIAELNDLTEVPGAAATVLGAQNRRGEILPVFDLAKVLGVPRQGAPTRLLITEHAGRLAGLAIDRITDVGPLSEVQPAGQGLRFVDGTTLQGGELVGRIELDRVYAALRGDVHDG